MCGRYALNQRGIDIEAAYDISLELTWKFPKYNIAPTQDVLAITDGGERRPEMLRWGLIPPWAKDHKIGSKMINARAESVAEKPSFQSAFRERRCLIVADSFYEWERRGGTRVPFRIGLNTWEPFGFAGLWEVWRSPEGEWVRSCTIITTRANDLVGRIHTRMPVMLAKDAEGIWLDAGATTGDLRELLVPYATSDMDAYEVSTFVNKADNDTPEVVEPVARML